MSNNMSTEVEKMKWFLSAPFILVVMFLTSFIGGTPAIVLSIIRCIKYKSKKLASNIIIMIVTVLYFLSGIVLLIIIIFVFVLAKNPFSTSLADSSSAWEASASEEKSFSQLERSMTDEVEEIVSEEDTEENIAETTEENIVDTTEEKFYCSKTSIYAGDESCPRVIKEYDAECREIYRVLYDENGNVSETFEMVFDYDENSNITKQIYTGTISGIFSWYEYEYDEKGNMVTETSKKADGSISTWHEYKYDEKGNMVTEINKNADGIITGEYEYGYDEKGNMVTKISKNADGIITGEYEYDTMGNNVKHTEYLDGYLYCLREYGANEKMIREERFDSDGNSSSLQESKMDYDEHGRLIKATDYIDDHISGSYEYFYNEAGVLIKEVEYASDGVRIWALTEYDEEGNILKHVSYDSDGNIEGENELAYDERGNLIRESSLMVWEGSSIYVVYEYEYDDSNNRIKEYTVDDEGNRVLWAINEYTKIGE